MPADLKVITMYASRCVEMSIDVCSKEVVVWRVVVLDLINQQTHMSFT